MGVFHSPHHSEKELSIKKDCRSVAKGNKHLAIGAIKMVHQVLHVGSLFGGGNLRHELIPGTQNSKSIVGTGTYPHPRLFGCLPSDRSPKRTLKGTLLSQTTSARARGNVAELPVPDTRQTSGVAGPLIVST